MLRRNQYEDRFKARVAYEAVADQVVKNESPSVAERRFNKKLSGRFILPLVSSR